MADGDDKAGHLVVYKHEGGGVWAYVYARSAGDIAQKYPNLTLVETRPAWMSDETYGLIVRTNSFDIDDEKPEWLKTAMDDRS